MTPENARANALAEMERGNQALAAARHLAQGGFYNDAISRAYYAAYHWARALLASRGIEPRSHRGVIQLLSLHFVKDGPLSQEAAAALAQLETYRELCDYTSTSAFTQPHTLEAIDRAERFISACQTVFDSTPP